VHEGARTRTRDIFVNDRPIGIVRSSFGHSVIFDHYPLPPTDASFRPTPSPPQTSPPASSSLPLTHQNFPTPPIPQTTVKIRRIKLETVKALMKATLDAPRPTIRHQLIKRDTWAR